MPMSCSTKKRIVVSKPAKQLLALMREHYSPARDILLPWRSLLFVRWC